MKSFLVSIFIHIGVMSLLIFGINSFEKKEEAKIVEVEFKEVVNVKKIASLASRKSKAASRGSKEKLAQFFPSMSNSSLLEKVQNNTEWAKAGGAKPKSEFSDSETFMASTEDMFGEGGDNKNWSYYQEVYRRIDTNLMFDSLLAQYGHFGKVYVQFKVTPDGIFVIDDLKTDAKDSILKVHVLRDIKKSLSESVDKTKFAKNTAPTLFKAQFTFTLDSPENNFYKQSDFGRPVFTFSRSTRERPIPTELLEHLMTGGINIHPQTMIDRWQKYNKRKYREAVQFDPFESYKRDAFYEL